ncbi:MAG: hypothetical protein U0T79_07900 [Ferruginibacter sp.]
MQNRHIPGDIESASNSKMDAGNIREQDSFYVPVGYMFFFASAKKNQKNSPAINYTLIAGMFPDAAIVLL